MRKRNNNTNKITFEEAVAMNEETPEAADNNILQELWVQALIIRHRLNSKNQGGKP